MSADSGTNRWWENYLVRYLMPSIAGVAIVSWICSYAGDGVRRLIYLPSAGERIDGPSLTLLFLYGNLFCYVASYPVLLFHVTRVVDFRNAQWPIGHIWRSEYVLTFVFMGLAFVSLHWHWSFWLAYVWASLFVIFQALRLGFVLFRRVNVRGCTGEVSPAYGFAYSLARRRGIPTETEKSVPNAANRNALGWSPLASRYKAFADFRDDDDDEGVTTVRQIVWRRDFMDTYRHMREHGNSAFTFALELALAALVVCVVSGQQPPSQKLGYIGLLFAIWASPAVFVHLLGQHLERRFSHYDRRVGHRSARHSTGA